mgnify:CR=1 FL=1
MSLVRICDFVTSRDAYERFVEKVTRKEEN